MDQYSELLNEFDARKAIVGGALAGALAFSPTTADAKHQYTWSQAIHNYAEDQDIVAKVLAGEGAGEGYDGMKAIACVIQNRIKTSGRTAQQEVSKRHQFSALLDPKMMEQNYRDVKDDADKLSASIGALDDITNGATHYVTKSYYNAHKHDGWLSKMKVVKEIGHHIFMKEAR